ncbi:YqaJ-domain containing exonuclease [Bacillus phage vB_BcM_Sam46]|uniref:YqaJ-domain containing exonuclease n=2 Tax=Caudoviricetes TaxID=2731619 RepID=A0A6G9L6W6_9CAUD|nr:YqaJ-domain containing exonuclease [Bacillus phage vB_BcM_Sam112]QIQ61248.1 YqaJ-domain containing exonuclease [Bacillus phage vB_BcM_Sam46]
MANKKVTKIDALVVAETKDMSHEEWLNHRYDGIGGSEASTIAGINKYESPYSLYLRKRKIIPQREAGEAAYWGTILEDVVRKHFAKAINEERAEQGLPPLKIQRRNAILAHKDHNFMRTNLDGLVFGHELGTGVFEAKTASMMLANDWAGEDLPDNYMLQVQHNMMVTGLQYAYVAVLIGGNTYKHYFIPRDEELIQYLMQIEFNWWYNHFKAQVPPPTDGTQATKEALQAQYPNSNNYREGEVVHLPNIASGHAIKIEEAKAAIKTLEEYKTIYENELKAMIGDQEVVYADKHKITWKTASNGNRPLKIKLEATTELEKIRGQFVKNTQDKIKEINKLTAGLEKEAAKNRKETDKIIKAQNKEAEKFLKAAQKDLAKVQKAAEKEAKALEKKTGEPQEIPEYKVISAKRLEELQNDSSWLNYLDRAGVDNWSGIDYAYDLKRQEEPEESEEN